MARYTMPLQDHRIVIELKKRESGRKSMISHSSNWSEQKGNSSGAYFIYDAKCGMCTEMAFKIRHYSRKQIEILALSDPEADELLQNFYSDDWPHDFYFIEGDTCLKGIKAFPKLMEIVGITDFGSLVRDYASQKLREVQCGHEHHEEAESHDEPIKGDSSTDLSRRRVMSMISSAAVPALSSVSNALATENRVAQTDPRAHVARVRLVGQGQFKTNVQRCPQCERSQAEPRGGEVSVGMEPVDDDVLQDITLEPEGSLQIRRTELEAEVRSPENAGRKLQMAIENQKQVTTFDVMVDRERLGGGFNFGYGPVVRRGQPGAAATMSGVIKHDLSQPIVDFITLQNPRREGIHASTHLEAYVAGAQAFREFYSDRGNDKMADLYRVIEETQRQVQSNFESTVRDSRFTPVRNHLAITGIRNFMESVTPPIPGRQMQMGDSSVSANQITLSGLSCACPSFCCGCCCGCGCGCGCAFPCGCGCACCCGCGCSCSISCGCCLCA